MKYFFLFLLLLAFVPALRRFLFWLVVGRQLVKEQKKYYEKTQPKTAKKSGEINVEYVPPKESKSDYKGGQYVDYEEVK